MSFDLDFGKMYSFFFFFFYFVPFRQRLSLVFLFLGSFGWLRLWISCFGSNSDFGIRPWEFIIFFVGLRLKLRPWTCSFFIGSLRLRPWTGFLFLFFVGSLRLRPWTLEFFFFFCRASSRTSALDLFIFLWICRFASILWISFSFFL